MITEDSHLFENIAIEAGTNDLELLDAAISPIRELC
jgi:hypothetical protein